MMLGEWFVLLIVAGAAVAVALRHRACWERRLRARPFPDTWRQDLLRHAPFYRRIPAPLLDSLHQLTHVFMATKNFEGAGGLELTDTMKVVIAAQACVLLLNRKTRVYPNLRSVVVYPDEFIVPTRVEFSPGHHLAETEERLGESWRTGAVVLSWRRIMEEQQLAAGRNLVLHEFAHQLDMENGRADGMPALPTLRDYADWAQALRAALADMRQSLARGRFVPLDPYAAKDEAEFFAVATEYFFEAPGILRAAHPEFYERLRRYYRQDPQTWGADSNPQLH